MAGSEQKWRSQVLRERIRFSVAEEGVEVGEEALRRFEHPCQDYCS